MAKPKQTHRIEESEAHRTRYGEYCDGVESERTIFAAGNLSSALVNIDGGFAEAKRLLLETLPISQRVLGHDDSTTLWLCENLGQVTVYDKATPRRELQSVEQLIQDTVSRRRRVLGPAHPDTQRSERTLAKIRARLKPA